MDVAGTAERAIAQIGDGWIAGDVEDEALDFKRFPPSGDRRAPEKFLKDLAESVVCFANGNGGVLIVGVADKAPPRAQALVGVDPVRWPLSELVANLFTRTSPSITVRAHALTIEGKTFYALGVPPGMDVYSTTEGVYKIRIEDKCMPLEGEQLRGLRAVRQGRDWSAESSGASWKDLSTAALEHGARLLRRQGSDELAAMALENPAAFGRASGIATKDGDPTRAAILLYGTSHALQQVPEWGVNVQTRNSPGGDGRVLLRRGDTSLPLVLLIDQLITIVGAIAQTQIIRVGAEQIELVDYPDDVLREIFANAFAHRDWEASGLVEIIHSPAELAVSSPGGLLPNLRLDRLLHDTASPRNRVLAAHMARLRLAEMSGLGFDRIFREIGKLGKEPPVLEDGPRFRVVLPGGAGDEAFARFLRSEAISDTLAEDVDVLMALTALRNSRSVNATTLSPRLQRNVGDAQRVLERMQSASLVHPTRGTARRAHPNYTLTPTTVAAMRSAITYRTSTVDHDDQKLLRHLKRHGRITNEDVRNYLDCDVETARNRLTRLRRRGVIDFAPDAPRRGAFVEYVLVRESERSLPERPAPKPSVDQPALFDGDV